MYYFNTLTQAYTYAKFEDNEKNREKKRKRRLEKERKK